MLAESISRTEYDVTAYRNVLNQLQTVKGEADRLSGILKGDLATTVVTTGAGGIGPNRDPKKLAGFMMQARGGKDLNRWTVVVAKSIGLNVRNQKGREFNLDATKSWAENKAKAGSIGYRTKVVQTRVKRTVKWGLERLPFRGRVSNYVFDIHNLFRNVNWELNRLRIEMPFDLRQLTNQLNDWSQRIRRDDWQDAAIAEWKIFNKIQELRDSIIPTMEKKIKEKIKAAELAEKVAADDMRAENEKTLTKEEKAEHDEQQIIKRVRGRGYKVEKTSNGYLVSLKGMEWKRISRAELENLAAGTVPEKLSQPKTDKITVTESEPSPVSRERLAVEIRRRMETENEKELETAAKSEGDSVDEKGGNIAVPVGLALLLLLGQG